MPNCDKITRMSAQSSRIEAGQVYLPRQERWLEDFRAELLQFPNGKHDDQVDRLSQFLRVEQRPRNRCAPLVVERYAGAAIAKQSQNRAC
jgi:hypothetical protein